MPKYIVTPELADIIKNTRIQSKIAASKLAKYLEKSPAYITKLEKGDIKSISTDNLKTILEYLLPDKKNFDEVIESITERLSITFSKSEIEEQDWLYDFDTVLRAVPIPEGFIISIKQILDDNGIDVSYLTKRINNNEFIPKEIELNKNNVVNKWINFYGKDGSRSGYIIINISQDEVRNIIERKVRSTSYVFLRAIVLYTLKIIEYGDREELDEDTQDELTEKSKKFLADHKIYTLLERNQRLRDIKSREEQTEILNAFDNKNVEIINRILTALSFASDMDVDATNKKLSQFDRNLDWDMSFMLQIISIGFAEIGDISFNLKKELLEKFKDSLAELNAMPEEKKSIEVYE